MFDDVKSIFASVTFWGIVISVLSKAAALYLGYEVDEATQRMAVDLTLVLITFLSGFAGDAIALWGRIRATKRIGS